MLGGQPLLPNTTRLMRDFVISSWICICMGDKKVEMLVCADDGLVIMLGTLLSQKMGTFLGNQFLAIQVQQQWISVK